MATTVGEVIFSEEMIVAQSDTIAPGTTVESLVIEFDQTKYEEFVSSGDNSEVSARKFRRISCSSPNRTTNAANTGRRAVCWMVKQSAQTPTASQTQTPSTVDFTSAGAPIAPLSKRAKQRRRQTEARRLARAFMNFDGR